MQKENSKTLGPQFGLQGDRKGQDIFLNHGARLITAHFPYTPTTVLVLYKQVRRGVPCAVVLCQARARQIGDRKKSRGIAPRP